MDISEKIEALLFWKAEPVALTELSRLLEIDTKTILHGLDNLKHNLQGRGIVLIQTKDDVSLGAKDTSGLIEKLTKDSLSEDLGKASLETISIVLYEGPVSRAKIDYIRGVNSSFILRNLLVRGLVERITNSADTRSYLYKPTVALLAHLGISDIQELPEYEKIKEEIKLFSDNQEQLDNIHE